MTGKTKTVIVLAAYFLISEILMVRNALTANQGWGVAISLGGVIGLFSFLAYRKKTWARHIILVLLGFTTYNFFCSSINNPSVFQYVVLVSHAFLFWALCWHRPILDYLGVIQHKKS